MGQCTAHTRDGAQCQAQAVDGHSVCWRHGVGSPARGRPGGRSRIHGAYARTVAPEEMATLEGLRALGAGLEEELAVARLQLARALAWSAEQRSARCDGKQCPYALVDSRLALVSRLAERCRRIADAALDRIDDEAWMTRIVEAVERHVTDPRVRANIVRELEVEEPWDGREGATERGSAEPRRREP